MKPTWATFPIKMKCRGNPNVVHEAVECVDGKIGVSPEAKLCDPGCKEWAERRSDKVVKEIRNEELAFDESQLLPETDAGMQLRKLTGMLKVRSPMRPRMIFFMGPCDWMRSGTEVDLEVFSYVRMDALPHDLQQQIREHFKISENREVVPADVNLDKA
jgi:hypothetical protein